VSFFTGNPFVSSNVSSTSISTCNWHSTSCDVWRLESTSRQGCMIRDKLERLCLQALRTPCQRVTTVSQASTEACACCTWALPGSEAGNASRRCRACARACCACRRRLKMASE
jgi:hypothetical protein